MAHAAKMIKISNAPTLGAYTPSKLDEQKEKADIKIIDVSDGAFIIDTILNLENYNVKKMSVKNRYFVNKKTLEKLRLKHSVVTDF